MDYMGILRQMKKSKNTNICWYLSYFLELCEIGCGGETGRHLIVSSEHIQVKNIIFYKALIDFTCAPYLS